VLFGVAAIGLARNPHGLVEQIRVLFTPRVKARTADVPIDPVRVPSGSSLVTVDAGTFVHRADCVLVAGKQTSSASADMKPCPVCEPVHA
jgi:hypothetical protein